MRVFFSDEFRAANLTFAAPKPGDAGYDLYALDSCVIESGERAMIRTGLHVEIPDGYVGLIKDRSSMAAAGLHTMAGVIDSSYRGELKIILLNTNKTEYTISTGQKIAQMLVIRYYAEAVQVVDQLEQLSSSERGAGGFGSTGK